MNEVKKWHWRNRAEQAVSILKDCGFDAIYAEDKQAAKNAVEGLLPEGASIGVGGSVTLNETGIMDLIRSPKYCFIDRFNNSSWEEELDKYRQALTADVFVTGTNAVTLEGQLVNMDCTGNRTSAIAFGPKKVIVVVGANKVVDNVEEGVARAQAIAPLNAKRINHQTPCAKNGICTDCTVGARICNILSVIDGCYKFPGRISVIVVAEELGY